MQNLVSAFAPKVAESFKQSSLTDSARGTAFSFTGVRTLKVMSVDTVPLNDYQRSGISRYGAPVELGDTVQELTMREDKSFAMTIDKGNQSDQLNLKGAAQAMRRQTEQVMVPYVDKYRFRQWSENAGIIVPLAADPAKGTIVDLLFDAGAEMSNRLVPTTKRTLFIRNSIYKLLKASNEIIGNDALGKKVITKGSVGEFDGMDVKAIPDSYFPEGVYFLIKYKGSTVDPVKLNEANIHQDPPGISGHLLEGRFYHDAFVLGSKADGLYAAVKKDSQTAVPTVAEASGKVTLTCAGATIYYTLDGSDPRYSDKAQVYSAPFDVPGAGTTLKAYGAKSGLFKSGVVAKAY